MCLDKILRRIYFYAPIRFTADSRELTPNHEHTYINRSFFFSGVASPPLRKFHEPMISRYGGYVLYMGRVGQEKKAVDFFLA